MALPADFEHHLHELMVEVSDELAESEARYKHELIYKAQHLNNSAALPIAYKDAELHGIEIRVTKIIEKYLEALSIWAYKNHPSS